MRKLKEISKGDYAVLVIGNIVMVFLLMWTAYNYSKENQKNVKLNNLPKCADCRTYCEVINHESL